MAGYFLGYIINTEIKSPSPDVTIYPMTLKSILNVVYAVFDFFVFFFQFSDRHVFRSLVRQAFHGYLYLYSFSSSLIQLTSTITCTYTIQVPKDSIASTMDVFTVLQVRKIHPKVRCTYFFYFFFTVFTREKYPVGTYSNFIRNINRWNKNFSEIKTSELIFFLFFFWFLLFSEPYLYCMLYI